jgi:hypothetical protein
LLDGGHSPEVVRSYGSRRLPDFPFNATRGRREAKRLAGTNVVPALVLDDGLVISGTDKIVAWARGGEGS